MWLLILALILFALDILVYFFGADSRPGFGDGRPDRKESWFIHSRNG